MSRVAFVARSGALWGAGEAGFASSFVDGPEALEGEILRLASKGYGVIAVTEDLLPGDPQDLIGRVAAASPKVSLLVVPGPGGGTKAYDDFLRNRFAIALGIDVWAVTARKAGGEV